MNFPLFEPLFTGKPEPTGPPLSGQDLRDSGIESVLSHTPDEYKEKFISVVRSFPVGYLLTAEDVRERAGDPPPETDHNALGGLMRRAAGQGLITPTDQGRNATRPSSHARRLLVWRRL